MGFVVCRLMFEGAGESGKSTLLKQMKLIHEGGYTVEERKFYRPVIFSNTVQSMAAVLDAMVILDIQFENPESLQSHAQVIKEQPERIEDESLPEAVGKAISVLWKDSGVQECFERSREYQLNDSAK